jgi:hypothetical protein
VLPAGPVLLLFAARSRHVARRGSAPVHLGSHRSEAGIWREGRYAVSDAAQTAAPADGADRVLVGEWLRRNRVSELVDHQGGRPSPNCYLMGPPAVDNVVRPPGHPTRGWISDYVVLTGGNRFMFPGTRTRRPV